MKKENATKKTSQAEFIRGLAADMPTDEIIKLGKKAGHSITKDRVRIVRGLAKTSEHPVPTTKKSKRTKRKTRRSAKPAVTPSQRSKRLAAGRKAAETRRANALKVGPKPKRGRPPKTADKPQTSKEQEFMRTAIDLGLDRSERILTKMRAVAKEVA